MRTRRNKAPRAGRKRSAACSERRRRRTARGRGVRGRPFHRTFSWFRRPSRSVLAFVEPAGLRHAPPIGRCARQDRRNQKLLVVFMVDVFFLVDLFPRAVIFLRRRKLFFLRRPSRPVISWRRHMFLCFCQLCRTAGACTPFRAESTSLQRFPSSQPTACPWPI